MWIMAFAPRPPPARKPRTRDTGGLSKIMARDVGNSTRSRPPIFARVSATRSRALSILMLGITAHVSRLRSWKACGPSNGIGHFQTSLKIAGPLHDRAAPATPEPAEMRIVRVSSRWASLHIDRRALPGQSHRGNFHLVEPMLIGILDILSVQWNWDL